jgi:hypothetical protein
VLVTDPKELEQIRQRELDITRERIQRIIDAGANVVLTTKGIDDAALKYFVEAGAIACRRVPKDDLRWAGEGGVEAERGRLLRLLAVLDCSSRVGRPAPGLRADRGWPLARVPGHVCAGHHPLRCCCVPSAATGAWPRQRAPPS